MKISLRKYSTFILNSSYFIGVFFIALVLSTLALTRRINSYEASQSPLLLRVEKDEIVITNSLRGRVEKVLVNPGQHVKKGDLMVQLADDVSETKISTLEKLGSENVSARTEALLLKAQSSEFELIAPRDGIVYKIHAVEGTYLTTSVPVVTLFSDFNVNLLGIVTPEQYLDLQKQKKLDVYSSRREQVYSVKLGGVSRVLPPTEQGVGKYELTFEFVNPEDAATFIQGENLDVIAKSRDDEVLKPGYLIAKFWNSFIIGK